MTEVFANGGIQRFNRTLLAAHEELGLDCEVLSLHDTPASIAGAQCGPRLRVHGFGGNRRRFALGCARALLAGRFDCVVVGHINFLSLAIAVLMLVPGRLSSRPVTLIAHGIEVWNNLSRRQRYGLLRTRQVLCVSHYTKRRLLEQVPGLKSDRLQIFPNALSETWRCAEAKPIAAALPERFILSVTRLEKGDRYKGIVTVIEALGMLADAGLHYVVVGQGNDLAFLKDVAQRLGVAARVHFLHGIRDAELITLYRRCTAFVLPSGKEGFGIVFLEAMYFGAPVVAAAEKGALDVVHDGETGLLTRFGDVVALAQAVERLAGDSTLRETLRSKGQASVSQGGAFTFARFVERSAVALELIGVRGA
jgi:glycosyltransferase involved in cell wall biosynthesis